MFPHELVVIGVHSAKFPTERLTENVRQAVMRHGIQHPVVNDADFAVWSSYAVRAWPTVVLIDPLGKVVGQQAGEIDADAFAPVIGEMVRDFESQGALNRAPIAGLSGAEAAAPEQLLRFPSKLTTAAGDRLFVADTGHHRVLEVQLSEDGLAGDIVRVFGSGDPGWQDGPIAAARFHDPHGLAFVQHEAGATLFVADTENHAVRAIDLVAERVRTVAGVGVKGGHRRNQPTNPTATALRSPWAVAALGKSIFIAMAGSHQIWLLHHGGFETENFRGQEDSRSETEQSMADERSLRVFAGTGAEALVDGARGEASFNQPSDLALSMGHLFVADAEASAIRAISLVDDPQVMTLVGEGLFDFGDVDGVGAAVRLQHPTGLAAGRDVLYIADSYNHKVKTLDPATGRVATLIGSGAPGLVDGPFAQAQLFEPEGLALLDECLYIADTNNHCVRVAELATGVIHTLRLG